MSKAIASVQQAQGEKETAEREKQAALGRLREAALRAEGEQLLGISEEALRGKDAERAEREGSLALARVKDEPALRGLKERAERVVAEAGRLRTARDHYRQLFLRRDEALFHLNRRMFTGLDAPDDLAAARAAANKAVELFEMAGGAGQRPAAEAFSAIEKVEMTRACFESLLLLAEATARGKGGLPEKESLREALAILNRANEAVPSSPAYHRRRARYLSDLEDEAGARAERILAAAARPATPVDAFLVGYEEWQEGNPKDALRHFTQALRGQPDLLWARFFLAIGHLKLRQPAQARAELTVCIDKRPDFIWGYLFRGFIHGELRAFEDAEADFERAAQLNPDEAARYVIHVNRGVMRVRQGQVAAAVADLEKAVELQPEQFHARLSLAQAYRKQQRWPAAAAQLDRAIVLKPKLALLYRERAELHLEQNDQAAALRDFEQALVAEPRGEKAHADHVERAFILSRQERYEDAAAACAAALKLQPDYPLAHQVRAEALLKLKRYEEAARYFGHYLEKGKPVTEVFQGRALAHAGRGNYAAAAEDYTQALACRPGDAPVLAARGWMYIANDAARLAQRDFTEVIRLDPKSGDAYNGRGYALARLGRHVEAARDVREALSRGPKSPRLLFNAARAFAQAAGAVRAEPGSPLDRTRIQTVYREESLFCLAEALALIPKGERRAFWQTYVALDSALNPIRPFPGFVRLAEPYQKPVRIVEGAQP